MTVRDRSSLKADIILIAVEGLDMQIKFLRHLEK
jgi:hypothetical protein